MTIAKAVVFALILANVGYFFWARGIGSAAELPRSAPSPNDLRLVSEVRDPAAAVPPAATAAAASGAGGTPGAGGTSGAGVSSAGGTPGAGGTSGVGASSAGGISSAAGDTAAAGSTPTMLAAAGARADAANPGALASIKRCLSVGPFADMALASRAAATLRSGGYQPRSRVAEGEVWAGVWVYLPVLPAPFVAQQVLAKLHAGGIDDALEMPGPNDTPVISLGLFSEPRRAQARVAQAQALGLNPGIADRKRNGDVYWLDVDLKPAEFALNTATLQGESGRIVRLETKSCPVAAP